MNYVELFHKVSHEVGGSVMERRDDDIEPQSGRLSAAYGAMRILIPEM